MILSTKLLAVCATVAATALVSVGMNLSDLAATEETPAPFRGVKNLDGAATFHAKTKADATVAADLDLLAEADALLAALTLADATGHLNGTLATRAQALAAAVANLSASTPADAQLVLDLKVRLDACLALLAKLEGRAGIAADVVTQVTALVRASLDACIALLAKPDAHAEADAQTHWLATLVVEVEKRVHAKAGMVTLVGAKAQATALLGLIADLQAKGLVDERLAGDLTARLQALVKVCVTLIANIEARAGTDGGECSSACTPPPACSTSCNEPPAPEEPSCEGACGSTPPPVSDEESPACDTACTSTEETAPCETACSAPTPPTESEEPSCESACDDPCGCPPPPCGCPDGDGSEVVMEAEVELVATSSASGTEQVAAGGRVGL